MLLFQKDIGTIEQGRLRWCRLDGCFQPCLVSRFWFPPKFGGEFLQSLGKNSTSACIDGEECRIKTARDTGLKWLVYSSTGLRVPVALWHIIYSIVFCWCFMMFFSATVKWTRPHLNWLPRICRPWFKFPVHSILSFAGDRNRCGEVVVWIGS